MHFIRSLPFSFLLLSAACATSGTATPQRTAEAIRTRTGADTRFTGATDPTVPPGISLDDGLSRDEAVALALWNSPGFQVSASQLGFARADLVEAGLLTNPTLSLLFPVGPKQLEATLRWPIEVLWERPRRVATARLAMEAAGETLVQNGLELALSVRVAYADLALGIDRLALTRDAAAALGRIDTLSQSRLRAGDISEIEARAAHVDAVRGAQEAERLEHDVVMLRERLRVLLGLRADDAALMTLQTEGVRSGDACASGKGAVAQGLAARPDVRAAELTVESAAARLGWERRRILAFTAVLDANGRGAEGFEMGPGLDFALPLFNRNQGGTQRARAELQRASAAYMQRQRQVVLDVREAQAQLAQARQSQRAWAEDILLPLQANLTDAEGAFTNGDTSYLFVLDSTRRVIDARLRERELRADQERAVARLERAIGSNCPGATS